LADVPAYKEVWPQIERHNDGRLKTLIVDLGGKVRYLDFESSTKDLMRNQITVVHRENRKGGGKLELLSANSTDDCHFHHYSNITYGAISTCDGTLVCRPF
jgi:hypothetical protein